MNQAHLEIIHSGIQSSIQGAPFAGQRHIAMPAAGAADPLSLALVNHMLGKPSGAAAIEISLNGCTLKASAAMTIILGGADCPFAINGVRHQMWQLQRINAGDMVAIGAARQGVRSYLAISRGFALPMIFGQQSTHMPSKLGGFDGRALKNGDKIILGDDIAAPPFPIASRSGAMLDPARQPYITNGAVLRYIAGPEHHWLAEPDQLTQSWQISPRASRMGLKLAGNPLKSKFQDNLASSPVFPGVLQLSPDGLPFLLGVDGQTSGGYPRIAQIIRADRHLIGQLRPGARLRLVATTPELARQLWQQKCDYWNNYIADFSIFS